MNVFSPTFACTLYRKSKEGQWQRYKRQANLTISSQGSLTCRDVEAGTLLADFPKAGIGSIDYLKDSDIVRISPVVITAKGEVSFSPEIQKIALMFPKEVVKSVVQELRRVGPLNVCHNSGVKSLAREDGTFELPNLNDPATLEMILALLFDDSFASFTNGLASVLEGFKDRMENTCG